MHFTPSGSRIRPVTVPEWLTVKTSPRWLPTMQRSSSTKMPNAEAPLSKRHRTGACWAVERVLAMVLRVTARRWRTPRTAVA